MIDPISKWLFPELKRFDTRAERWRAWEQAHGENRFRFMGAVMLTLLAYALVFLILWGPLFARRSPGKALAASCVTLTLVSVGGVFLGFAPLVLVRRSIRRSLRRQLTRAGMPTCVCCGYDLRGQTEPRCPECGRPFEWTRLEE